MRNHSKRGVRAVPALAAVLLLPLAAGCSSEGDDNIESDTAGITVSPVQDVRQDIDPIDLVGIDANALNNMLFAPGQRSTSFGDENMHDIGNGVKVATGGLNFSRRINPARGDEFANYTGNFRILTACSQFDESEGGYYLYVGTLPPDLATDEVLARGRAGEYNKILQEGTGCRPWGPTIPVSKAR